MTASKEAVRRIVRQCEEGEGAAIPKEDFDSDGELDNSKIFCAICRLSGSTDVSSANLPFSEEEATIPSIGKIVCVKGHRQVRLCIRGLLLS